MKNIILTLAILVGNIAAAQPDLTPVAYGLGCATVTQFEIQREFRTMWPAPKIANPFPGVDDEQAGLALKATHTHPDLFEGLFNGGLVIAGDNQVVVCSSDGTVFIHPGQPMTVALIPSNGEEMFFDDGRLGNELLVLSLTSGIDSSAKGSIIHFDEQHSIEIDIFNDDTADLPVVFLETDGACDATIPGEGFRTIACGTNLKGSYSNINGTSINLTSSKVRLFFANEHGMPIQDEPTFTYKKGESWLIDVPAKDAGVYQLPDGSWDVFETLEDGSTTFINFGRGETTVTIINND